jgi:hypothetical protein
MQYDGAYLVNSMDDVSRTESNADLREAVKRLRFIIALLIEKNERMRQQSVLHPTENGAKPQQGAASIRWSSGASPK